ncbi:hypothetical protein B0I37DRAFT_148518 [Chaetomium sp. MPI-CAGE-AT-0009]|nr:hypothetical protein B0I37DRAFT_148518 [Chaetomium sp. MPI-CAGE-AT-0009]
MTEDLERQLVAQPSGLLSLSPYLRRHIYLYLGVASLDGHPYTHYLDGRKAPSPHNRVSSSEYDPPPASNFMGLLRSCRSLYAETSALLYSAHRFVIFYSNPGSLGPLRAMSPTSIASLTSLKIVLNESSCHDPTDSWQRPPYCCSDGNVGGPWCGSFHCAGRHGDRHRRPLLDSTSDLDLGSAARVAQATSIMTEWHDIAAYLSPHIAVGRLTLLFVCDIDPEHQSALEIARLATAPIALFPQLKSCHVRLGKIPNYPLQQLAQEAVLRNRDHGSRSPVRLEPKGIQFPLMSLPTEVRLRVLEYTDLITPWKEVTWSRQDRGYQVCLPPCRNGEDPHVHHGCRLSRCDPGDDHVENWQSPGCFCRRRHAAFSLICNCWCPPTNLFLVCRTLRREAELIFFSHNHFIVHDFYASQPWDIPRVQYILGDRGMPKPVKYYPFERYAASEFLQDIVPSECLAHLRFLELVFPPYIPRGWPQKEHSAPGNWFATIEWVRGRINAPALTIRLVMADVRVKPRLDRGFISEAQAEDIINGNKLIMDPLRALVREDGLAGFYMEAADPQRWTDDTLFRAEEDPGYLARLGQRMKETGEEYVRGNDIKPGSTNIKPEPRRSTWNFWYEPGYY